jgi:hypothetical protein
MLFATAPIIVRGVVTAALSSAATAARRRSTPEGLLGPLTSGAWLQRRSTSSATGAPDVRDVRFCFALESPSFSPAYDKLPGAGLDFLLTSSGRSIRDILNRNETAKRMQELFVLKRVASLEPTALEERDGVYWPAEMPLHELVREHGIMPNNLGEVFVLAGPPRIGDRAFWRCCYGFFIS